MAVGINIPKKPSNGMGNVMSLAGAAAGGLIGGRAGVGVGMQAGGMIGQKMQSAQQTNAQPVDVAGDAISRRKAQLDNSPLRQIRDSIDSLKYVQDDQQRAELAKPLLQADYIARMKGQNVS